MKRLLMVFAVALVLVACGENTGNETGTGGSIDSASTAPTDNTDNPEAAPYDTSSMDTTSSQGSGAATGSGGTSDASGSSEAGKESGNEPAGSSSPVTDDQQSR